MLSSLAQLAGELILRYLDKPTARYQPFSAPHYDLLRRCLKPGDVLLVEGNTRLSAIIKYLTQSTWSHAALYIGDVLGPEAPGADPRVLVEAQPDLGVIAVPLSKYAHFNTRICRPVALSDDDCQKIVSFAVARLGNQYDNRHVLDLARYLFPYPPVPVALRRRLLAFGSREPTRAICSTLIAEAFQSIRYPILPNVESEASGRTDMGHIVALHVQREILHIRDHGLFTPRDFDLSPYFAVIKPIIEDKFDYRSLIWAPK
jgi:hypothetical protein